MFKTFLTIGLVLVLVAASEPADDVEAVLELISQLRQSSQDELNALLAQWQGVQNRKKTTIAELDNSRQSQFSECERRRADVEEKEQEIHTTYDYIDWMTTRKAANTARIEVLSHKMCESQINYIDGVKSSKILLNIIEYFRRALKSYQEQSFTEVHEASRQTISEISRMVKVYKDSKQGKPASDFLQVLMKELTTQPQEGGEHTVAGTISELLAILDQMENEVKSAIGNGQDNQVQSGVTYSDFKQRLERENETFEKMAEQQKELIDHYARQLVQMNRRLDKCHETLNEIKTTIDGALQDYGDAQKDYTAALQRLREELELFDELYAMYLKGVVDETTEEYRDQLQKAIDENNQLEMEASKALADAEAEAAQEAEEAPEAEEAAVGEEHVDVEPEATYAAQEEASSDNVEAPPAEDASEAEASGEVQGAEGEEAATGAEEQTNEVRTVEAEPEQAPEVPEEAPQEEAPHQEAPQESAAEPDIWDVDDSEATVTTTTSETTSETTSTESETTTTTTEEHQEESQTEATKESDIVDYTDVEEKDDLWMKRRREAQRKEQEAQKGSMEIKREGSLEIEHEGSMTINKEGSMSITREGSMTINRDSSMKIEREGSISIRKEGSVHIDKQDEVNDLWN